MNAQNGNQNQINLATGLQNGLGVVVAEGYRVVSVMDRPTSKHLSSDCPSMALTLRSHRRDTRGRITRPATAALWSRTWPAATTAVDPARATDMPMPTMDMQSRLPAAAWAAFVLNHALCG